MSKKDAQERYKSLSQEEQRSIDHLLESWKEEFAYMTNWQRAEYLDNFFVEEVQDYPLSFHDILYLMEIPGFRRSTATEWVSVYRLYRFYIPEGLDINKLKMQHIRILIRNYRGRVQWDMIVSRHDFTIDPSEILTLATQLTWQQLDEIVKRGTVEGAPVSTPIIHNERELCDYLWQNHSDIERQYGIQLIHREVATGEAMGDADFIGLMGKDALVIEVKNRFDAQAVGQLLGYVGELRERSESTHGIICYPAPRNDPKRFKKPKKISCRRIVGSGLALEFGESAYYAAKHQELLFYKFDGQQGVLIGPLSMKTATKRDWTDFVGF